MFNSVASLFSRNNIGNQNSGLNANAQVQQIVVPDPMVGMIIQRMDAKGLLKIYQSGKKWHNLVNECFRRLAQRDMPNEYRAVANYSRDTWREFYFTKKEFTYLNHTNQLQAAKCLVKYSKISITLSAISASILASGIIIFLCKVASGVAVSSYMQKHGCSAQEAQAAILETWKNNQMNVIQQEY